VHERTKPPAGKEFEQVVEFTEFDRPAPFHVHIVEGPYPSSRDITATCSASSDPADPSPVWLTNDGLGGAGSGLAMVARGPVGDIASLMGNIYQKSLQRGRFGSKWP
jgi:hypothetical protein